MRIILFFVFLVLLTNLSLAQTAQRVIEKGNRAAAAGHYKEALQHYQKSLLQLQTARDPSTDLPAKIYYNTGVCFYHLNQFAQAIAQYDQAIGLRPNYQRAFRAKAMVYVELKNWTEAKNAFKAALALDKNDGESWFDLAMIFIAENDYERAAECFRQAIVNQSVDSSIAHNNLGVILALKHNFAAAEKEFRQSLIESNGAFTIAKNNLAFCRERGENSDQKALAKLEFSSKN